MGSVFTNKYSEGYPSFDFTLKDSTGEIVASSADAQDSSLRDRVFETPKTERSFPVTTGETSASRGENPKQAAERSGKTPKKIREMSDMEFAKLERQIASEILPDKRYYGGQENTDRIERLAIARACRLFAADHANVQPHSGAQANNAVYNAWCDTGDTILGLDLAFGGHLTHGSPVTQSAKIYNFISYKMDPKTGEFDYDEIEKIALEKKPKIILVGYSAYSRIPDFAKFAAIAKKIPGCLLMADMAHVAGLIVGKAHPNPFDFGFHVITTTTHKTLRGPRGGLILSRGIVGNPLKKPEKTLENIPTLIDRSVFPGTQGGPLMHIIAAKAVSFHEALQPEFRKYVAQIIKNAKVLSDELLKKGFKLITGGTSNHLILADVFASFGVSGGEVEKVLDIIGLTLNKNAVPNDSRKPFDPSGIRLGTPAITTRGLKENDIKIIAGWIFDAIKFREDSAKLGKLREEVRELARKFPLPSEKK
jgi:glycine hydroxymethyltransferase